jgi:hypothetical protein
LRELRGEQAREKNSKENFDLTALLRSLSFGGTDERREMSGKRERFRRGFELRLKSIDLDQLNEVSGKKSLFPLFPLLSRLKKSLD